MDVTLAVDRVAVVLDVLIVGIYLLWVFLLARDVLQTRREVSSPVSLLWVAGALLLPFGFVVWVIHRRRLLARER